MQNNWLQSAVAVAQAVNDRKPVSTGAFDDLSRIREHFEELERARLVLRNLAQQAGKQDNVVASDSPASGSAAADPPASNSPAPNLPTTNSPTTG
jgi:hypothetical protein